MQVNQDELDKAFPEHAKMRDEAAAEREKLGITLEGVAWVMKKLHAHMLNPGTYRHLIYQRMGFPQDSDAYGQLLVAGLMNIHNHLADYGGEK